MLKHQAVYRSDGLVRQIGRQLDVPDFSPDARCALNNAVREMKLSTKSISLIARFSLFDVKLSDRETKHWLIVTDRSHTRFCYRLLEDLERLMNVTLGTGERSNILNQWHSSDIVLQMRRGIDDWG
ncbi:hypothetical protein NKH95_29695 [Mesorhizobium sp. M0848]|uniref:hypothetical protein n=1 Tax=Mesorhizobium sp. M0848 TaxID=2957012 RepID=UPI003335173B